MAYTRGSDGTYQPYGIVVLTATAESISRITSFGDPGWSPRSASRPR